MASSFTDEELLACPELVEARFIYRGRRDLITTQAGKEFLYFDLCTKQKGKGFSNFLKTSDQVSCYTFQLKIGCFLSLLLVTCIS